MTAGHVLHWAPLYDLFGNLVTLGRAAAMRDQTVDLAALQSGERVLEVGCGTGEVAQRARVRLGPDGHVSGIDPSAGMIDVARKKTIRAGLEIDYRVGAIEALPYPDAGFDVVLSSLERALHVWTRGPGVQQVVQMKTARAHPEPSLSKVV